MTFELRLSSAAEADIEEQVHWYEADDRHGGTELSSRWLSELERALEKLRQRPGRFGFAPENGRWQPQLSLRQMPFRPWKSGVGWRVLFVIDETSKVVTVLQVRHERRKWLSET